ncbi:MAG TPA: hypothetical protein VG938_17405 [Verrucomicrobiae bacterium]|jgi:hypothetical protein|nr:hypothetical protein [Verrucomicrobiae bacterium]
MNEPWSYFTDDEVFGANVKERQSIAAIRGKDDLPDICEQVTGQIRQAYIFSNRELGADGTIPDGLKSRAVAIATWRFVSEGVPQNDGLQTRGRKDAFNEAINYLNQIASVKIGRTSCPAFSRRGVNAPPRHFTDTTQDG